MQQPSLHNPENLREIHRPIASVVIISADNKILMGRKDPGKGGVYPDAWHIPGGGIDEGETLEQAARREALEEVGVDLSDTPMRLLPFVDKGESPKMLSSGEKVWCNMVFNRFEARLSQPAQVIQVSPNDDLVELRWFDEAELKAVELVPGGREFFIAAGYIAAG
ncbi:MAG TPA: NUDIX hydrolase [Candidatus Saccharimonadales bacterium]|nr:NUDIX hydrolase [Candidatus Saccharimonadales bacterium]